MLNKQQNGRAIVVLTFERCLKARRLQPKFEREVEPSERRLLGKLYERRNRHRIEAISRRQHNNIRRMYNRNNTGTDIENYWQHMLPTITPTTQWTLLMKRTMNICPTTTSVNKATLRNIVID
jgi:hypothetical protein